MISLRSTGDVVERQSFLNGIRSLLFEGAAEFDDGVWSWTLALTLPKDDGAQLSEGDLSLVDTGEREWYSAVTGGTYRETTDDETGAGTIVVRLELSRQTEAESTETWTGASGELHIHADTCELTIDIQA
ncbi:MAG: hypothetical protein ACYDCQ_17595 [Dehalococcoidia bacterium]